VYFQRDPTAHFFFRVHMVKGQPEINALTSS
jgi:hypothetical protein